jgi:diketogulonate reductase-like aldo/keto reductase
VKLKELGDTGVTVPEIAQGTWQFKGDAQPLRLGIDLGARFIDTAEKYGNESVAGEAIRGRRQDVFLASKISPSHFRRHDVVKAAEASLRRLQTDYLDLYQLHLPNYVVPIAETMSAMEELVVAGKIRFIGVSNFSVAELKRANAALSRTRIVSNQVRYSLLDRAPERELLPYCEANRISLLAYSPLATGHAQIVDDPGDDILGQLAKSLDKTRAQIALNWCISHPAVIAIFKAQSLDHVRENCGASDWCLTSEQRLLLSQGVADILTRSPVEQSARRLVRYLRQRFVGAD